MDRKSQIRELITPAVIALGCELWGVEYLTQGRYSTVRVFIDKEGGVLVDDCERVSKQVSALLDVEDPIRSAYTLEVSSPGVDRQLFEPEQYERFLGAQLNIRLRTNLDGRRKFSGKLVAIEDNEVILHQDDEELVFPLETVDRAQIVPEFEN